LKQIAELVSLVQADKAEETPEKLDTPGKRALYNNLQTTTLAANGAGAADAHADNSEGAEAALDLALKIDSAVKAARPDGWRGIQAREMQVKQAIYGVIPDINEVNRLFQIIFAQSEY
jgi:type I restriction enzyme R subunit